MQIAVPVMTKENVMAAKKKAARKKYSDAASKKVEGAMHERKRGTLKSGGSGKKVTSKKQAIAIGLSEARRSGMKVPRKRTTKKRAAKKRAAPKKESRSNKKVVPPGSSSARAMHWRQPVHRTRGPN